MIVGIVAAAALAGVAQAKYPRTASQADDEWNYLMSAVAKGDGLWHDGKLGNNGLACGNCHPDGSATNPHTWLHQLIMSRSVPTLPRLDWYLGQEKGSVLDKTTGLTWMRCSVGQHWAGNNCAGEAARYTWQDADWVKDTVNLDGYADHTDWRIPVVPELASIVELGCINGRVNPIVFPAMSSVAFWSSMEKPGTQDYVYTLNFGVDGGATPSLKSTQGALRLVRGGPWWTPPKR